MPTLLGIDVGTSGCKALLIDGEGRVLRQASAEYPLLVPHPMWSEQNPEDWWAGVESCLHELGNPAVDAIGLTGQMHGAVFLDADGKVIRPAILWNDQRTVEECREIEERIGRSRLMEITCNPPLTGFQIPKILWLRKHEPAAFARLRHVLLPKDFIRYRLTGELYSEASDASGTGVFDVPARRWAEPLISELGLEPSLFPSVAESWIVTSNTAAGVPVVGGGGDQAAAAVGTGAVVPGIISVSLGTSGVVFTALDAPKYNQEGAAHTFCHANGAWHSMGVMLSCGGALRWFRDAFRSDGSYDQMAAEADAVEPGSGGLTFLPYLTGERCPHNDPFAKAVFAGLRLGHGRDHMGRAVFEGITFGLRDCLDLLLGLGATAGEIRVTGGGAKSSFWLQMLSDVFGMPCHTLDTDEGPAFGAAILAGVGVGVWPDVRSACEASVRRRSSTTPSGRDYSKAYDRYRALYASTKSWNRI